MTNKLNGSYLQLPIFHDRGDEDEKKNWFHRDSIWNEWKTMDATRLVEFETMLRGRVLKWYMKCKKSSPTLHGTTLV